MRTSVFGAAVLAAACTLAVTACGSSGTGGKGAPASKPSTASGGTAPSANSSTVLHVSGAFTAVAPQSPQAYQAMCATTTVPGGKVGQITIFYDTTGSSGPSNIYELDMTFIPAGATTTLPIANPKPGAGATLRLSYNSGGDYLDWGYAANPSPGQAAAGAASGTVTMSADATSGTYDVQLPFTGDDNHTVAAGSKPAAHLTGGWACAAA